MYSKLLPIYLVKTESVKTTPLCLLSHLLRLMYHAVVTADAEFVRRVEILQEWFIPMLRECKIDPIFICFAFASVLSVHNGCGDR